MKHFKGILASGFGIGVVERAFQLRKVLFVIPWKFMMLLVLFALFTSVFAFDLYRSGLVSKLFQEITRDNVKGLYITWQTALTAHKDKLLRSLTPYWSETVIPLFAQPELQAIKAKLQLMQANLRAMKNSQNHCRQKCEDRSDEMKSMKQLLRTLQDAVAEVEKQQKQDRREYQSRAKLLLEQQEHKFLALQTTVASLTAAGKEVQAEQSRLVDEQRQLRTDQQNLEKAQKHLMDRSMPTSDSIERVQTDVEFLRCYLLDEADSRRSMLDGRRSVEHSMSA